MDQLSPEDLERVIRESLAFIDALIEVYREDVFRYTHIDTFVGNINKLKMRIDDARRSMMRFSK